MEVDGFDPFVARAAAMRRRLVSPDRWFDLPPERACRNLVEQLGYSVECVHECGGEGTALVLFESFAAIGPDVKNWKGMFSYTRSVARAAAIVRPADWLAFQDRRAA